MEEEYDTDAFVIFVIAMISIYIIIASIFLYRRFKRYRNKEPAVFSIYIVITIIEIFKEAGAGRSG